MHSGKRLVLLLFLSAISLGFRCEVFGSTDDRRDALETARHRWESRDIVSYEYRYRNQCGECLPAYARAYDVRVVHGFVVRIVDAETGALPPEGYDVLTVPELFTLVDDALERADVLHVEYDPQLGYPSVVSVDWKRQVADDEFVITVQGLRRAD